MDFDVSLNARPCAAETAQTQHLVANKLVIRRVLKGQKASEKDMNFRWPVAATITPAHCAVKASTVRKPASPKLVETCPADPKQSTGLGSTQNPGIKICHDSGNELRGKTMENLFLFKPLISALRGRPAMIEHASRHTFAPPGARRIRAASPSASATLQPPERRLGFGCQQSLCPKMKNSTFAPSLFTFAPATTPLKILHGLSNPHQFCPFCKFCLKLRHRRMDMLFVDRHR